FVSVASGHLTLLAVGQVLQRSLEPALLIKPIRGGHVRRASWHETSHSHGTGKNFRLSEDNRVRISFPHEKGKHGTRER
ncbi:hypothetical protein GBC32_10850, partial [Bifidobacterium longum]